MRPFCYASLMTDPRRKLRLAIWRRTRAWVEVYRQQPESDRLIRSLLLGVENGIRRRTGTLPEHERGMPKEAISRAFLEGQLLAEQIPASILAPFHGTPWVQDGA